MKILIKQLLLNKAGYHSSFYNNANIKGKLCSINPAEPWNYIKKAVLNYFILISIYIKTDAFLYYNNNN